MLRNKRKGKGFHKKVIKKPRKPDLDERIEDNEILSEDSGAEGEIGIIDEPKSKSKKVAPPPQEEEESDDQETAEERRLKLAKNYISKLRDLEGEGASSSDEEDRVDQKIAKRLKKDALLSAGKAHFRYANQVRDQTLDVSRGRWMRGHRLPPTCCTLSEDNQTVYSGSKDGSIFKWDLETGKKTRLSLAGAVEGKGLRGSILSLAVSSDGGLLAVGSELDNLIHVFDTRTEAVVESFKGHRGHVSALCFQSGTRQLFSGSGDRTIKIWNMEEMMFVDTLYGHEAPITCIDALQKERCVTTSQDKTVRLWKVPEQTQLKFEGGPKHSIDCVRMVTDDTFISGSQDGTVSVWSASKKKPVCTASGAHGGSWISSIGCVRNADLVATGAGDGVLRFWQCNLNNKQLIPINELPLPGFVNGISFANEGQFVVAAVGQEHRLGRWYRDPKARNGILVLPLTPDVAPSDD